MPDELGRRTTLVSVLLPRSWPERMEARARRAGFDDVSAWMRYHLGRVLDAPEIEVAAPTGPAAYRDVARRLARAVNALQDAATVIENVAAAYADADGRAQASILAERLRSEAAELSA